MKKLFFSTCLGLVLIGLLITSQGVGEVLQSVARIGWAIIPVILIHISQVFFSGAAWFVLSGNSPSGITLAQIVCMRWIREAVSNMLPVTQIGGEVIAIRLLILRGMGGGQASATVIVDLTMEVISQVLFIIIGLILVILGGYHGPIVNWMITGAGLSILAISAFLLVQSRGLFRLLERLVSYLTEKYSITSKNPVDGLHDALLECYRHHRRLFSSCFFHLVSWVIGGFEVWLILSFLGHPVTLIQAMVLESFGQAIRSAAFFIPGGLGAQEAGYLILGMLYGLSPETGLALSLVKRLREIILGIPGLIAWQIQEGKHFWRRNNMVDQGQKVL